MDCVKRIIPHCSPASQPISAAAGKVGQEETNSIPSVKKESRVYDTCIVMDCCTWLEEMSAYTRAIFSDVEIRVTQSNHSLTGFCVILKIPERNVHCSTHVVSSQDNNNVEGKGCTEQGGKFQPFLTQPPTITADMYRRVVGILFGSKKEGLADAASDLMHNNTKNGEFLKHNLLSLFMLGCILNVTYTAVRCLAPTIPGDL